MSPQDPPPAGKDFCVSFTTTQFTYHGTAEDAEADFDAKVLDEKGFPPHDDGHEVTLLEHDGAEWLEQDQAEFPPREQT